MGRCAVLACLVVGTAAPVFAQAVGQPIDRYQQYGEPVDVSISDLVHGSAAYEGRAVRTHGRLEMDVAGRDRFYSLRSNFGDRVRVTPVREIATEFTSQALTMLGGDLEVTGVFFVSGAAEGVSQSAGIIQFWRFVGPEPEVKGKLEAPTVTLESLVTAPGRHEGRLVRVVGQFRGKNLFGDLPVKSRLGGSDWVLKDDVFAVWVKGKKPKGSGFELDASLKRDTGKWLEVIGRVETRGGVTYVAAQRVALGVAPTPTAKAEPPAPPPERPKLPPVVVFSLPLDGEAVGGEVRFAVQFSKDMNEQSFKGHVVLRYAGRTLPGDREFDGLILDYDGGRRALIVDPGDRLRPGRQVELLLLPGIVDIEGLALIPRPGRLAGGEAVDVLRYETGYF